MWANRCLGYFEPRRCMAEDAYVVPHISYWIVKFDSHINVEFSALVSLFQYLFKYFFKGPDEVDWKISKVDLQQPNSSKSKRPLIDQIRDYEHGRYLTATEVAYWLASFHITRKHPAVKPLLICLPGCQHIQMRRKDNSQSDGTLLEWYMSCPCHPQLDWMTYTEFGRQCYMVHHNASKPLCPWEILKEQHQGRPQQRIHFYENNHVSVSHIQIVYPCHGNIFYLHLLLLHWPALLWENIRMVNNVIYATHQDTCYNLFAFFLFTYLIITPDRPRPLIDTTAWRSHVITLTLRARRFCFSWTIHT